MRKVATHIVYCDECHDLVIPRQIYHSAGGRLICSICWGDADAKEGGGETPKTGRKEGS